MKNGVHSQITIAQGIYCTFSSEYIFMWGGEEVWRMPSPQLKKYRKMVSILKLYMLTEYIVHFSSSVIFMQGGGSLGACPPW